MHDLSRRGLTLVEMLVAMTASLILFGAVITVFQILGDAVNRSRRTGRLDSDLCSLRLQLQQDLAGVTANRDANGLLCEVDAGSVNGYFEVIEGPDSDLLDYPYPQAGTVYDKSLNQPRGGGQQDWLLGDTDDMLFFTTRSQSLEPFTGKFGNTTVTSSRAEVAYFCTPTPDTANPQLFTLRRRQLVITGGTATWSFPNAGWDTFYLDYDVSARREGNVLRQNNANDLQRRRNRFGHDLPTSAANQNLQLFSLPNTAEQLSLKDARANEDVLATNVLAFDVRLLDPLAVERQSQNTLRLQPGDKDYATTPNAPTSTAVYGDLGFQAYVTFRSGTAVPNSFFSGYGRTGHALLGTGSTPRTYDTWTLFYRSNNENDDLDPNDLRDDIAEGAPYPEQLRGLQVTLRLYDVDTRTVKQATITTSFRK